MTLDELSTSLLVTGKFDGVNDYCDVAWRLELVQNLRIMVEQLWEEGITEIFIDGSFATDKPRPGDIDGYFVVTKTDGMTDEEFEESLCQRLNKRDKNDAWTWKNSSRKRPKPSEKGQLPMWWQYNVEMWPEYGQSSHQIHPIKLQDLTHAEVFRITRTGDDKGIIKLLKK